MKLKTGNVVSSNKYGTLMTVVRVQGDHVECAWFSKLQEPFRELFLAPDLTFVRD